MADEIHPGRIVAPYLLGPKGSVNDALQLYGDKYSAHRPLVNSPFDQFSLIEDRVLYLNDAELSPLEAHMANFIPNANARILNLPNSIDEVRYRQKGVQVLLEQEELYQTIEHFMHTPMFMFDHRHSDWGIVRFNPTTHNLQSYINTLESLEKYDIENTPFQKAQQWAQKLKKDNLMREHFVQRRKVNDNRLILAPDERYDSNIFKLKEGVQITDFADPLSGDMVRYFRPSRSQRNKIEDRWTIKTKGQSVPDQEPIVEPTKQAMYVLNEISAKTFAPAAFLTYVQIAQLFAGAGIAKHFQEHGIKFYKPNITSGGSFKVRDATPLRVLIDEWNPYKKKTLIKNSYHLEANERIIYSRGPSECGKTEAWRTKNLLNHCINMGWYVPARVEAYTPVAASKFISCKGSTHRGGSEFRFNINDILLELGPVPNNSEVIFDEFGDSTNEIIASEAAKMVFNPLVKRGCRVYATTHHTGAVLNGLDATSFIPKSAKGLQRFKMIRSQKDPDYAPKEVLASLGLTDKKVESTLGNKTRIPRPRAERKTAIELDKDNPF